MTTTTIDPFHETESRAAQKFGRLTFVRAAKHDKQHKARWICRCDCGTEREFDRWYVTSGHTKSCGCLALAVHTTHGMTNSHRRLRWIWALMKARCSNPNLPAYKNYGGRGIIVCDRWKNDFAAFVSDMGECPPKHQIDRIDNNGNYEPSNCRWATRSENNRNTRQNRKITINGITKILCEWEEIAPVGALAFRARIYAGWPPEIALIVPYGKRWKKYVQTHNQ